MAHWSSHGYLAKGTSPNDQNNPTIPTSPKPGVEGYVVLKRQGEHMITTLNQPQSLPINAVPSSQQNALGNTLGNALAQQRFPAPLQMISNTDNGNTTGVLDRKYYSVKGYGDMRSKHNIGNNGTTTTTSNR